MSARRLAAFLVTLAAVLATALPVHAQRQPYYAGYSGKPWATDYGVVDGRCDRQAVSAVVGVIDDAPVTDGRMVAVALGRVFDGGASPAAKLGAADRGCIGQSLELVPDGQGVFWLDTDSGTSFRVTLLRTYWAAGQPCREFRVEMTAGKRQQSARDRACRTSDGAWRIIG